MTLFPMRLLNGKTKTAMVSVITPQDLKQIHVLKFRDILGLINSDVQIQIQTVTVTKMAV